MTQYDAIAKKYKQAETAITKKYVMEATFLSCSGDLHGKRIVDLACGSGYFTRIVKQLGASEVVGIDISTKEIQLAQSIEEASPLGITYQSENLTEFDFNSIEKFDIATAIFFLHYASTKEELLSACKNVFRSLKNGGRFISINNNPSSPFQADTKYEVTSLPEHTGKEGERKKVTYYQNGKELVSFYNYIWSRETYESALQEAGFEQITWHPMVISEQGIAEYGSEFWDSLRNTSYIAGLTCVKPV